MGISPRYPPLCIPQSLRLGDVQLVVEVVLMEAGSSSVANDIAWSDIVLAAARYPPTVPENEQTTFHIRVRGRWWWWWWRLSSILILKVIKATQSHFHMQPPSSGVQATGERTIKRFNRDSWNLLLWVPNGNTIKDSPVPVTYPPVVFAHPPRAHPRLTRTTTTFNYPFSIHETFTHEKQKRPTTRISKVTIRFLAVISHQGKREAKEPSGNEIIPNIVVSLLPTPPQSLIVCLSEILSQISIHGIDAKPSFCSC